MQYKFFLDSTEIEEPIGWADLELSLNRDDTYHGMQFEVSTGSLRFFGVAAAYLQAQKRANGISSNVTFTAQETCDTVYETIATGRLNFGKYKEICGDFCIVEIPFEEVGCKVIFKNRFDQKVDIDNLIAYDNMTVLPNYTQLGQIIEMPAKALKANIDGSVALTGFSKTFQFGGSGASFTHFRPEYEIERYNSIKTGQLSGANTCENYSPAPVVDDCFGPITPQFLFEDLIKCFSGEFSYTSRMKGTITWDSNVSMYNIQQKIYKWDANGTNLYLDGELVQESTIYFVDPVPGPSAGSLNFDDTLTGTVNVPDGWGLYAVLEFDIVETGGVVTVNFDTETSINIETVKICPPTDVQYYMVHEAISRIVESITNKCMRAKSAYYGRIDSQPFSFTGDGCGSLRMITGGLKLRNAPNANFFLSIKDLISGLNAIDNIGFAIEEDTTMAGKYVLVIEEVAHFYQNAEIMRLDNIASISNEVQESQHYAKINVGYKKWEVQQINGLNEINSNREYRTNVDTINTTLDILSVLVSGSYPSEVTRQQSFADSGAADTTYDNETFIYCLIRNAYNFQIEQDKVLNDSNIYDPATLMNFRITPIRNLMRWFKSIINTYPNITSSGSRLFFNAGTANFIAAGLLDDNTSCRLENNTITENDSIGIINFTNQLDGTPLFKNETASFDYPLSVAQYNFIKANPYGYISYTCGNSNEVQKGFIKEIKFRPARGMANFTLRKKWETI